MGIKGAVGEYCCNEGVIFSTLPNLHVVYTYQLTTLLSIHARSRNPYWAVFQSTRSVRGTTTLQQ